MIDSYLQSLFDEYAPALVLFARQWCDCPEDAVQEAFIDLSQLKQRPQNSKAWLYTTTRRKAMNILRSESRRRKHYQKAGEQNGAIRDQVLLIHHKHGSLARIQTPSSQKKSRSVWQHSLLSNARFIVAKVWGEMNFEQLAELLECSVSSAHRRYASALGALKQSIEKNNASNGSLSSPASTHAKEKERPSLPFRTPSGERT